jgi:WD40 repeat protein
MNVIDSSRKPVILGQEISRGGEGVIYAVPAQPGLVAKIYTNPAEHPEAKLAWMKANPPQNPSQTSGHSAIAWPLELLYAPTGTCTGFLMPYVQNTTPLLGVFNPRLRAGTLPGFDWRYLHRAARNLALAVGALHARDYVVGDLNESNILVTPSALVTLIDTDSFQVRARKMPPVVYYCPVGRPEYTPPELQGKPFHGVLRRPEHDRFGLGVLIFQLLMDGSHPFRAQYLGAGDPPSIEERIARGWFPYAPKPGGPVAPPPNVPSLDVLSPEVAALVRRCFVNGHRRPEARPSPKEWSLALAEAEHALNRCPNGHYVSGHLRTCPACGATIPNYGVRRAKSSSLMQPAQIHNAVHNIRARMQPTPALQLDALLYGLGAAIAWLVQQLRNLLGALPSRQAWQAAVPKIHWPAPPLVPHIPTYHPPVNWAHRLRLYIFLGLLALLAGLFVAQGFQPCGWADARLGTSNCMHIMAHPGPAWSVAFAPDGESVAAESLDHTLRIWHTGDGTLAQTIPSHADGSAADVGANLVYLPGGNQLMAWAGDALYTWDVHDGQPVRTQKLGKVDHWPNEHITGAGLSQNMLALGVCDSADPAMGCDHTALRLWRVSDGAPLAASQAHTSPLTSVAFSPGGRWVAGGACQAQREGRCLSGEIFVWRTSDGKQVYDLKAHAGMVSALAFSSDGALLASGAADGSIVMWQMASGTQLLQLAQDASINSLAFSAGDTALIGGSRALAVWRLPDGAFLGDAGLQKDVLQLALAPNGSTLAAVTADNQLVLWHLH